MGGFFVCSTDTLLLQKTSIIITPLALRLLSPDRCNLMTLLRDFSDVAAVLVNFNLQRLLSVRFFRCAKTRRHALIGHVLTLCYIITAPLFLDTLTKYDCVGHSLFSGATAGNLVDVALICYCVFFFIRLLCRVLQCRRGIHLIA